MRRQRFVILGLGLLAASAVSIVVAHAQTTAVGPYYATPSWDQKIPCTSPSNCPRFVVLSNWNSEAVLDRETGLVWEREPNTGSFFWESALFQCLDKSIGGRKGWRLPTVEELNSLVDTSVLDPPLPVSLPVGHPFILLQVDFNRYWSATNWVSNRDSAWTLPFFNGHIVALDKDESTSGSWCVRGGQGAEPQ